MVVKDVNLKVINYLKWHLLPLLVTFPLYFSACKDPIEYANQNKSVVVVINRAGEPLTSGTLLISNHTPSVSIGRIGTDSTAKAQFENFGDGAYVFSGTFQSGRTLRDSMGYVTNGMNFEDTLFLIQKHDSLGLELKSMSPKAY